MRLSPLRQERGRAIYKFADLLEQHSEELAHLETLVSVFALPIDAGHAAHTLTPNGLNKGCSRKEALNTN